MTDGVVGVKQSTTPDRLIDNEVLNIGGQDVYRQRVQDPEAIALLQSVKTAVEGTIVASISGDVSLSVATLAALETVNAVVTGAVDATVSGIVALDAATLAALESVSATVSGTVALDAPTLAALESITATISGTVTVDGTVELGATTLQALENIKIDNFPVEFPLPAAQVSTLTPPTTVSVTQGTAGAQAWPVSDDCVDMLCQHITLTGGIDTTITFAQEVRIVRVVNWSTTQRVLVKNSAITSDTDAAATRVGKAPAADVPGTRTFPFRTSTIHLRSAGDAEVSVEGYV